jgi:hypothetical protein
MAQASEVRTNPVTRRQGGEGLMNLLHGTVGRLACKCSSKNDVDFLVKKDTIVCSSCGNEVACFPPLIGVYQATCSCCVSAAIKSTFVLDSRGVYTCTWCGRAK